MRDRFGNRETRHQRKPRPLFDRQAEPLVVHHTLERRAALKATGALAWGSACGPIAALTLALGRVGGAYSGRVAWAHTSKLVVDLAINGPREARKLAEAHADPSLAHGVALAPLRSLVSGTACAAVPSYERAYIAALA